MLLSFKSFMITAGCPLAGGHQVAPRQTAIGISDTLMCRRGDPEPSDADMSSLYGMAMPLVKHCVALDMVHLERVSEAGYLDDVNVLLLTYEGQNPSSLKIYEALAAWIREGHVLILFGTGDAYDEVANGGIGMAQITCVLRRTFRS